METQPQQAQRGVALPEHHTGSTLFHSVLSEAVTQFPAELANAALPEHASAFKRNYGALLARFEAQRVSSSRRVEIAQFISQRAQAALQFAQAGQRTSLSEHLAAPCSAPELHAVQGDDTPSLRALVPLDGQLYRGREVIGLADRLLDNGDLTFAARAALQYIVERILQQGGVLDLRGERFVLLGAGAELAITPMLLQAGATVLWIDLAQPIGWLDQRGLRSGTLVYAEEAGDLLQNPRAILATIERFIADGGPAHFGLFAYASGSSQEWRLGAAMNAIVDRLDPAGVRSVSLLVSPTTVPTLQPESVRAAERQLVLEPVWKSALHRAGLLPKPGHCAVNGTRVGLSTVSIQGLSYQAAQYVSKLMAAETFAAYGPGWQPGAAPHPTTVSANVAGITRTRSLEHPLFEAAFLGASRFGVRIFDPDTTRALSGLLILHDLLNPAAPGSAQRSAEPAAKAAALFSQQVHGGIYNMPYVLEHAIRVAALIGMGKNPSVLLRRTQRSATMAQL